MQTALVIGASGDVGRGITTTLLDGGWQVIAVSRSADKLQEIFGARNNLTAIAGDLATETSAEQLWQRASAVHGGIDAIIVSVNAPIAQKAMFNWTAQQLGALLHDNVLTHFNAAKCFIPKMAGNGIYIGIGGGMADFIAPASGHLSMAQAALRMMYRAIAKEHKNSGTVIKELMIVSMVNGASRRDSADPSWITDLDIGRHLLAILGEPARFPGDVLKLKAREQVGQPET